jgi:hypothetical protein
MYKLQQDPNVISIPADNKFIPRDPKNKDYQEFLKWEAEGNVPEPADAIVEEPPTKEMSLEDRLAALEERLIVSAPLTALITEEQSKTKG